MCLSQDHICPAHRAKVAVLDPGEGQGGDAMEDIVWPMRKRPFTYVLTDFVPRLREFGVDDADVERIFVDNPRRLLAGA